jgi:predicted nucleotidyltransferase
MSEAEFLDHIAARLGELPGVDAVALGGSRAQGTERPDSDWDLAVYYRDRFDPQDLRKVGWPGEVSELGGWGGGVFNGGAWLRVDGRRVDVHYRDLNRIDLELAEAEAGRLHIEPLMFHLAGIPSYLVLAELAVNRVLRGRLPRPIFPAALQASAPREWWANAEMVMDYARTNHAPYGRLASCVGLLAQGASQAAHAVLAARAEWVTNEKTLLDRASLRSVDAIIATATDDPARLRQIVNETHAVCGSAVKAATKAGLQRKWRGYGS